MTAFARAEVSGVSWEIRSVNQRYLDVNFKIPESFRFLEPQLRDILKKHLDRGKVECLLRVDSSAQVSSEFALNEALLHNLKNATQTVAKAFPEATTPTSLELLQWPGVVIHAEDNREELGKSITQGFKEAVDSLKQMRAREGGELARMIEERLIEISKIVVNVRSEVKLIQQRQQEKIRSRIEELNVEVDAGRLEQELVYQAQKSDVAEELDRLETHIEEVKTGLASNKPVGRRLDFLMQELNREANTLSSKAIAANTTIAAVELKVMIEQMREQVQNIE